MNRVLSIYPSGGLANNLIGICWGLYWKKRLNCRMEILWEVSLACNIDFENLFAPLPDCKIKTFYTLPSNFELSLRSIAGKLYKKKLYRDLAEKKGTLFSSSDVCYYLFGGTRDKASKKISPGLTENKINAEELLADWSYISKTVNDLMPVKEISSRVCTVMEPYSHQPVIGIHVRRTDHVSAIENSPLSLFVEKMNGIMQAVPDVCFYLATDDEEVERQLAGAFPLIPRVCFSKEKTRWTETGVMDAYVDMLCLGRCDRIYGSYGSTFSMMGAAIGRKELIILRKK